MWQHKADVSAGVSSNQWACYTNSNVKKPWYLAGGGGCRVGAQICTKAPNFLLEFLLNIILFEFKFSKKKPKTGDELI